MSTIESNVPNNLFVLKHKDLDVAMVAIDLTSGKIEHVLATYLPKELPVGCSEDSPNSILSWWESRAIPDSRRGIQQALNFLHEESNLSLMLSGYGLSLTDHYWMPDPTADSGVEPPDIRLRRKPDAAHGFAADHYGEILRPGFGRGLRDEGVPFASALSKKIRRANVRRITLSASVCAISSSPAAPWPGVRAARGAASGETCRASPRNPRPAA